MRRPRYIDFDCPSCGNVEERFVETNDDGTPLEPQVCNTNMMNYDGVCCEEILVPREIGLTLMAPLAGKDIKTNMDDATRQRERLEKRQDEHWKKKGRDEAIDTERAFLKKMNARGGVR